MSVYTQTHTLASPGACVQLSPAGGWLVLATSPGTVSAPAQAHMHLSLGYAGVSDPGAGGGRLSSLKHLPSSEAQPGLVIHASHPLPVPSPACQPSASAPTTPPIAHLSTSVLVSQMPIFHLSPSSAPHPCLLTTPSAASSRKCSLPQHLQQQQHRPRGGHAGHTSAPGLRYSCRWARGDQVTCMGASRGPFTLPEVKTLSQPPESRFWLCCSL